MDGYKLLADKKTVRENITIEVLRNGMVNGPIEKFSGGPVGLETLSATLSEDKDTIEDVVEPYLLQLGFIQRTSRGRIVTPAAYAHLKMTNSSSQDRLI